MKALEAGIDYPDKNRMIVGKDDDEEHLLKEKNDE